MKVFLGIECYYDYCGVWKQVVKKVFDDEVKALVWKEEFKSTETEWRTYKEMDME